MHKTSFLVLIMVLVLALGGWAVWMRMHAPAVSTPATTRYDSPQTDLAFTYQNTYVLDTRQDSFNGEPVTVLLLTDPTIAVPDMSEGPTNISVLVVNDPTNTPLDVWVKNSSISNFNLSATKTLASTTLGGEPAVKYLYSGLYENDAVAVAHGGKKYLFFGSWAGAEDPIRSDFQSLLKTVKFN